MRLYSQHIKDFNCTARLGAKRGYDNLQDNSENLKSFKIPARF